MNYWEECIMEAFEDAGITATDNQITTVVNWVEGAHDTISNPILAENDKLKTELRKERNKVICLECQGRGRIISHGPHHSSDRECYKCQGEGRISF
jgi:DnaJ-class molecular chaperone